MEKYYIEKMNSRKDTGRILGIIPIPSGSPFKFILANLIFCSLLEIFIGFYFLSFFLLIVISYDMILKNKMRIEILENCILEEIVMAEDLKENGVGEWEYDSPTVTDEDRNSIFLDYLWVIKSRNKKNNIFSIMLRS